MQNHVFETIYIAKLLIIVIICLSPKKQYFNKGYTATYIFMFARMVFATICQKRTLLANIRNQT